MGKNKIRYMPSNGTDGMMFVEHFCLNCINEKFMHTQNHDDKKCEILTNSLINNQPCFDEDLENDGWEWFRDESGLNVECRQWQSWDWGDDPDNPNEPPEPPFYDPDQLVLFSFDEELDELLKEQEEVVHEQEKQKATH